MVLQQLHNQVLTKLLEEGGREREREREKGGMARFVESQLAFTLKRTCSKATLIHQFSAEMQILCPCTNMLHAH